MQHGPVVPNSAAKTKQHHMSKTQKSKIKYKHIDERSITKSNIYTNNQIKYTKKTKYYKGFRILGQD